MIPDPAADDPPYGGEDVRPGPGHRAQAAHPAGEVVTARSEEVLRTETEFVQVGRARLVTHLVTEDVTITVPLTRQEVRLVYDEPPDGPQIVPGPLSEHTHDIVLHEEQAVITTRAVPVERVRLRRQVVTVDQTITTELSREQIDDPHTGSPTRPTKPGP